MGSKLLATMENKMCIIRQVCIATLYVFITLLSATVFFFLGTKVFLDF